MKIIYNSVLPPKGFTAINLFGVIFARKEKHPIDKYVINHELIHTAQIKELFFIPFYILYTLEWIVRLIQFRNPRRAYFNISFEREAYDNDSDLRYLRKRKLFAFTKYLLRKNKRKNHPLF